MIFDRLFPQGISYEEKFKLARSVAKPVTFISLGLLIGSLLGGSSNLTAVFGAFTLCYGSLWFNMEFYFKGKRDGYDERDRVWKEAQQKMQEIHTIVQKSPPPESYQVN